MKSPLITFVLGVFTGAAGKYFADKYTDKRRNKEKETRRHKIFLDLAEKMPNLIKEIQEDLSKPECTVIREFFILPHNRIPFNPSEKSLLYYEDQHKNLIHNIKLLENNGFFYDVTYTGTPKYRMTEEFVDFVIKAKIKSKNKR